MHKPSQKGAWQLGLLIIGQNCRSNYPWVFENFRKCLLETYLPVQYLRYGGGIFSSHRAMDSDSEHEGLLCHISHSSWLKYPLGSRALQSADLMSDRTIAVPFGCLFPLLIFRTYFTKWQLQHVNFIYCFRSISANFLTAVTARMISGSQKIFGAVTALTGILAI